MSIIAYIRKALKASQVVFSNFKYIVLAFFAALINFLLALVLANADFIRFMIDSNLFTAWEKVRLIVMQLIWFVPFFTVSLQILLVLTSLFVGINIALFVFYIKITIQRKKVAGIGFLGIISGFLGVGCSACGAVVLSSIVGIGISTQIITFLPLQGYEFSIVALIILLLADIYIAHNIESHKVCSIKNKN